MGKRKNKDEEDRLARKMRKLERKMAKIRRDRVSSSSNSSSRDPNPNTEETMENVWNSEGEQTHDFTSEDIIPLEPDLLNPETQTDAIADVPLDDNILNILGDEPTKEECFSDNIHKDVAVRWSEILLNGLKEYTYKDILKSYEVPENLKLALPPRLNPEIKAAVNESFIKRDNILMDKQKALACTISCLSNLMSKIIKDIAVNKNDQADQNTTIIKHLSDVGRLLCHLLISETATRKQFLLSGLSKNVKDNVKDLKRDQWLFGEELSEKLKSMKAISKTGAEMKAIPVPKPKAPFKNRQPEASTSRALNWRGPPPPPPRPAPTRQSSTTGGRRQPPVTSHRPAPPRRPARHQQPAHQYRRR